MTMWLWTLNHLQKATDPDGNKLYHGQRQGVTFALADALCWLLASRCQILDVLELEARGPQDAVVAEGLAGTVQFFTDLCHTQAARAAGEVSRICAELVFGYNRHPAWDEEGGKHASRAGTGRVGGDDAGNLGLCHGCGRRERRSSAEGRAVRGLRRSRRVPAAAEQAATCLSGSRLAKDRAAETVSKVMIPEALDYPA